MNGKKKTCNGGDKILNERQNRAANTKSVSKQDVYYYIISTARLQIFIQNSKLA